MTHQDKITRLREMKYRSGLGGGEHTRPVATVTFTAPKLDQVMPPACDAVGELIVAAIGTPPKWIEDDEAFHVHFVERSMFARLFEDRDRGAHKGCFGHVLIVGGAAGNLIDRLAFGFVLDYVDVYWRHWHFWAFNVADAAITCGVLLLTADLFRRRSHVPSTP
jgi:hypothetical protein